LLSPGTQLGPYEIVSPVGAGGMGEVYKAHDARLNRTVAIKVLTADRATPESVQRLEQEARAASALNHPNILTIYDVGPQWIAMEWIGGGSLREVMDAGPVPLRRVARIAQQIADGLASAHAAGIVHRDIKPENVMITSDGVVKIVDFGIAKLADPGPAVADAVTRAMATGSGLLVGTIGYMSPEQASGRAIDYRSDQFALGLLVYELVTGRRPFQRATTAQSLAAIIESEPIPIETLNRDVSPHLAAIVSRCLEKDPADRYDSTRDLARDLRTVTLGSEGRSDDGDRAGHASKAAATRQRWKTSAVYSAFIVLVAAAAGGTWLWTRGTAVAADPPAPLIAVQQFRSLSPDPAQSYFAAGVTEEIRGQLSRVASLRILARNAVEPNTPDGATALRTLGVTRVVDGSVRVEGKRVRITAELVDPRTQQTLWSDEYDRDLADVLGVQGEVAVNIVRALRARLSPDDQRRLEKRPTANAEAYELYLRAGAIQGFNRDRDLAAVELLREALVLDPHFAAAKAAMGFRHVAMGYYDAAAYADLGITEAEEALGMDPALPLAHFAIGTGYSIKGMDQKARLSFLRALELDPNDGSAMANLSVLDASTGRLVESALWSRRMFALSGRGANAFYHACVPLLILRADPALRQLLTEGERRFPQFQRIQFCWANLELYEGKTADSYNRIRRTLDRFPDDEEIKFARADIAYLAGAEDAEGALDTIAADVTPPLAAESVRLRRAYFRERRGDLEGGRRSLEEAERIARGRIDRGDHSPTLRVEMAAAAILRNDHAAAVRWLDEAYDAGYRDYGVLQLDPILARLEPAAKLRDFIDRIKRDVDAQREDARAGGLLDIGTLLAPANVP
jgi:TolB-like protein/predicted Ser/Thr protein kinase